MDRLSRSVAPNDVGPEVWIKRLRANEAVSVVVLSDKCEGFNSHWTGNYSTLCIEPHEDCPGHQNGDPIRWRAYLHCMDLQSGKEFFLELTRGAWEQVSVQIDCKNSWRGMRLNVKRMAGDAARLKVEINAPWERITEKPLPEAKDPEASIRNLYRKNSQKAKK